MEDFCCPPGEPAPLAKPANCWGRLLLLLVGVLLPPAAPPLLVGCCWGGMSLLKLSSES